MTKKQQISCTVLEVITTEIAIIIKLYTQSHMQYNI